MKVKENEKIEMVNVLYHLHSKTRTNLEWRMSLHLRSIELFKVDHCAAAARLSTKCVDLLTMNSSDCEKKENKIKQSNEKTQLNCKYLLNFEIKKKKNVRLSAARNNNCLQFKIEN